MNEVESIPEPGLIVASYSPVYPTKRFREQAGFFRALGAPIPCLPPASHFSKWQTTQRVEIGCPANVQPALVKCAGNGTKVYLVIIPRQG